VALAALPRDAPENELDHNPASADRSRQFERRDPETRTASIARTLPLSFRSVPNGKAQAETAA